MPETPPSLAALYRSWLPADGIAELDSIIADAKKRRGVVIDEQKIAFALVCKYTWRWPPLPRDVHKVSAQCPDDVYYGLIERGDALSNPCSAPLAKAERQAWIDTCRAVAKLVADHGLTIEQGWRTHAKQVRPYLDLLERLSVDALTWLEARLLQAKRVGESTETPMTLAQLAYERDHRAPPKVDSLPPAQREQLPAVLTQMLQLTPATSGDASQRPSQRPQPTKPDRIPSAQFLGRRKVVTEDPLPWWHEPRGGTY